VRVAKVTCSEDMPEFSIAEMSAEIRAARASLSWQPGRTSKRGPGTGVKGAATWSFG
jgi:hypothetical protein